MTLPYGRHQPDALDDLPPSQVAMAIRRWHAVQLWDAAVQLGRKRREREVVAVTARVLPLLATLGVGVSRTTLFAWRRSYRADGIAGLADLRGAAHRRWKLYGPFLLEVEKIYTSQLMDIPMAHDLAAQSADVLGWTVPTLRDTQKYVKRYILPGLTAERGGVFDGGSNRASNDI